MPKPSRDYALAFKRDIEKLDARIAKLQADRLKLAQAYALISGDESTYGVPAPRGGADRAQRDQRNDVGRERARR